MLSNYRYLRLGSFIILYLPNTYYAGSYLIDEFKAALYRVKPLDIKFSNEVRLPLISQLEI